MWECYFFSTRLRSTWLDELVSFWKVVEVDTGARTIFTQPHEPDFPPGELDYTDFLANVGYSPDPQTEGWWSKAQ